MYLSMEMVWITDLIINITKRVRKSTYCYPEIPSSSQVEHIIFH